MTQWLRQVRLGWVLLGAVIVSVAIIAMRPTYDTDMYWHLASGRWMVENRAILQQDFWSHTITGRAWLNEFWLMDVLLYALYVPLGMAGMALYVAACGVAGLLIVRQIIDTDPLIEAAVLVLAAMASAVFWNARPQMISFVLFAGLWVMLWRYQQAERRNLWLAILLLLVWANLHGGWAMGIVLLILAALGEVVRWLMAHITGEGTPEGVWKTVAHLLLVTALSLIAIGILNPYGPRYLLLPIETVSRTAESLFIEEWASPDFGRFEAWLLYAMLAGTLAAAGLSARRLDGRHMILVVGFGLLALMSWRTVPFMALLCAPVLALYLDDWLGGMRNPSWVRPVTPTMGMVNVALLALFGAGVLALLAFWYSPDQVEAAEKARFPVEAAAHLDDLPEPVVLFNSYNWGGYLILHHPEFPVFIDGRTDLYGDEQVLEFAQVTYALEGWDDILDGYGVNTVLIENRGTLYAALQMQPGWTLIYEDALAALYSRSDEGETP